MEIKIGMVNETRSNVARIPHRYYLFRLTRIIDEISLPWPALARVKSVVVDSALAHRASRRKSVGHTKQNIHPIGWENKDHGLGVFTKAEGKS